MKPARTLVTAVALAALYLLFAGQFSATEATAGAAATLAATLYAHGLHQTRSRSFFSPPFEGGAGEGAATGEPPRATPILRLLRYLATSIPLETARVAAALLTARPCAQSPQPFRHGGAGEARRRALVTLALSLAPNGFVTGEDQDHLTLHRLHPQPPSPDRDWPL